MLANFIACLLAVGYFACLAMLDLKNRAAPRVNPQHEMESSGEDDVQTERTDAYQVAVLLSIGAAILSLFA